MKLPAFLRVKRFNVLFIVILLFWIISLLITPLLIPSDTVVGVDGYSNIINNNEIWNQLPFYPQIVYYLGDILCHQKEARSVLINGNQMAVCIRCLAVYIGLFCALPYTVYIPNNIGKKNYLLYTLPKKIRHKPQMLFGNEFFPIVLIGLFLLPIAIDGGLQLITYYESNHILRLITGFPAGWIGGILFGALINS